MKNFVVMDNHITDDICNVMVETLQGNSTLEHLNIMHNNIGEEAIKLIIKSLRHNNILRTLAIPEYSENVKEQLAILNSRLC